MVMVAPSINHYRSFTSNDRSGDGDGGGRRHNSTHRLLIGASFFLALIITFISHVSIHEFRQHEEQPCGDNNNKVDEILKAVSKLEQKLTRLEKGGGGTKKDRKNEFCGHCPFNEKITCQQRVQYMMQTYGVVQTVARTQKDVEERCNMYPEDEPYVLIHVGPHKTGTTAIQSLIYTSESVLKKDNILMPTTDHLPGIFKGIGPMLNLAHCAISGLIKDGGQMNVDKCNKLRKTFTKFLTDAYENQQNVLIVAEDFDRVKIDFIRLSFYLQPYKRIKIVAAYRRLHDWLPSWYNQIVELYTVVYVKGDEEYPSLVEWMEEKYDHFKAVHSMSVADRFRESGIAESIDFLNMHDESVPMLENFFCNYVPGAETMCQVVREGQQPKKSNAGSDHEWDRIAVKASRLKKLPQLDRYNPGNVGAALKQAAEDRSLIGTLPFKCLNQTILDDIINTEINQEKEYLPSFFEEQGGEDALRKVFEKSKGKFCALNVDLILEMGTFDSVFEELSKDWKF